MRKIVVVLLGLLAVSASAQTPEKATRVSFFLTNPGWSTGGMFDGGIGLALEHRFTEQWSVELEAARELHEHQPSIFSPRTIEFRTYPADFFVRYSFENNTRWRPFLGVGARYVTAPDEPTGADYDSELSPEFGGGVEWEVGESLSIVFDGKVLAKNEIPNWDEVFKVSVGAGWRF